MLGLTRARQLKAYLYWRWLVRRNRANLNAPSEKTYTQDWFSYNIPLWETLLHPLAGRRLCALEIGVFEGRSTVWLMEHVLTHPESTLSWIDPFTGPAPIFHARGRLDVSHLKSRFENNTEPFRGKLLGYVGHSHDVLKTLTGPRYDLIYIDGSHAAADVLSDAILSWPLLNENGLLGFDDYGWKVRQELQHTPALAIDAFMAVMKGRFETLHHGYQVWLRKLA